jgi:hypothetical protein
VKLTDEQIELAAEGMADDLRQVKAHGCKLLNDKRVGSFVIDGHVDLRSLARAALTALQDSVVVPAKPFGYFYWKSNGDGTESPDFCEGEVPSYVRVVRGLTPLYTQPIPRHDGDTATDGV